MPIKRPYFPALDSLRAIAFLLVFSAHIGPSSATAASITTWTGSSDLGPIGLNLFFVLSGFLITCLLLVEQKETGHIDIGQFYLRRMRRIWPLYFIIVGISQFLIPLTGLFGPGHYNGGTTNFGWASLCFLLFLPNYAFTMVAPVNPLLAHTWSIGAEEQFYLFWPLVLKKCRRLEGIFWIMIALALPSCLYFDYTWMKPMHGGWWGSVLHKVTTAIYWSNMGFFALGGLMAFYLAKRPALVSRLSGRLLQGVILLLFVALVINGKNVASGWGPAVVFAIAILQATQPSTLIGRLRFPWLRYLGKISYGMYIFHVLLIALIARWWAGAGMSLKLAYWGVPALALAATVIIASISYYSIERYFLRRQHRIDPAAGTGRKFSMAKRKADPAVDSTAS